MDTAERTDARTYLSDITTRLDPRFNRDWAIEQLDALYRTGSVPDPLPDGFLRGRLLTMSLSGPSDAMIRRIAGLWMPWLGKKFDLATSEGVNVLLPSAKAPMKVLWPSYEPEAVFVDRIEAFPFRNRVAPGAADPDLDVYKIDYDFDANPGFLIRRILDELVEVDDDVYLGKILLRWRGSFKPIGYFSLER
jgi:hypothetical protein